MAEARIGTVDIPARTDRARYFRELDFLELSALFAGPLKPSALASWAAIAPKGSLALVAPYVLTHRKPPKAAKLWPSDPTTGDFRDSAPGRVALAQLRAAVDQLGASHVVFKSPPLFAASAANRDTLKKFFGEIATEETVGAPRVWVPDGLWDLRTAIAFAAEIDVICAWDPLVRDPGQPPEVHYDLDVSELYLRIAGLGRTGPLRSERQDDLLMLLESYEDAPATIAFESPERWKDARNLKKSLEGAV
ncbi:MAG: DUF72 domain-containing protein [Kofleriaceae bacterium]|nr:DUF72 domain-containing protein [Kofleriaceae bacterium]